MDIKTTLQQLSESSGASGREAHIAGEVKSLLDPLCNEVHIDPLFNTVGIKRGFGPEPRPRLMIMTHIDEIFMLVSAIEGPFLRFRQHSYDPRILVGQEVIVLGRKQLHGVIGDRPPHLMDQEERSRMPNTDDLVIDLGMDADEVAAYVQVGDVVLVDRSFVTLLGDRVAGKAFDNRLCVSAMLETLAQLQSLQHPCDVLAVASVGEEINLLGAKTATFGLVPDLAVVMDVTFGKQPGVPDDRSFELDCGPVIGIGPNLDTKISDKLVDICEELELAHELDPTPGHSGTDAWAVQVVAGGVPVGLVGIAIRNMHSPVETADLKDVSRTARLLSNFVAGADQAFVDSLAYELPDFEETVA